MRRDAVSYLACPDCGQGLTLAAQTDVAVDGHVLAGELICAGRGCRFLISDGVPILMAEQVASLSRDTARRFDEQWKHWREIHGYYEQQFLDWIAPVTREEFAGKVVLEGGCGKGRHSVIVSSFGPRALVSIDLGESAFVAFENTRHLTNVHIVMGDLTQPPVKPIFDIGFSVGVLHHLPDPTLGFARLSSRVRDDGRVVAWVYGRENNEWITRWIDPLRKMITSKIPAPLLRKLTAGPSAALWAAINHVYPRAGGMRDRLPYADYFSSLRGFPMGEIHNIVFDQLVTPVAYYLGKEEVERWMATGFSDVEIRWKGRYSWTAAGRVTRAATQRNRDVPKSECVGL